MSGLIAWAASSCGGRTAIDGLSDDSLLYSSGLGGTATTAQSQNGLSGGLPATGSGGQVMAGSGGQRATGGRSNSTGSSSQANSGPGGFAAIGGAVYGGSGARVGGDTSSGGLAHSTAGGSLPIGGSTFTGGAAATGGAHDCGTLIDDMEDKSGFICNGNGRHGAWYSFGSGNGTQWPAPTDPGTPIVTSGIPSGRGTSLVGMHTYGSMSPYAGIGFDLNYDGKTYGAYDASNYDGISFWARGSGTSMRVRLSTVETTSTQYGGTCTLEDPPQAQGCQAHARDIIMGDAWEHYWVPFASLPATSQPPDNQNIAFRRDQLTNMQFYTSGAFDFWVDDVSFFNSLSSCCAPTPAGCDENLTAMTTELKTLMSTGTGEPARCEDVCFIERLDSTFLNGSGMVIASLEGLQCAIGLKIVHLPNKLVTDLQPLSNDVLVYDLTLNGNQIRDIEALGGMSGMKTLDLSNNQISDISALQAMTQLVTLNLASNLIESIAVLGSAAGVTSLNLNSNHVSDIAPLKSLTNMRTLGLGSNQVKDLNALGAMTHLTQLDLSNNAMASIATLPPITSLTSLDLGSNAIVALDVLSPLTSLSTLDLGANAITSIDALATLKSLTHLDLSANGVQSVDALSNLPGLYVLSLNDNAVSDLWPLVGTRVANLSVAHNRISDLKPVGELTNLTVLDASYNLISDASSLSTCRGLGSLNLSHNQITDLTFLTQMSDSAVAELDMSANRISKLDELLNCSWITSRVPSQHYGYQPFNFDFSGNPIDCTEQASNIQALRNYAINLTIDCP